MKISNPFRKEIEKETPLDPKVLMGRIVSLLNTYDYRIKNETNNAVLFKEDFFQPRWSPARFYRLDKGKIEVLLSENGKSIVKLTCYV